MKSVSETILQNLNTLLIVFSPEGQVDYVSPSVQRLLGYDSKELLGEGWWQLRRSSAKEREDVREQVLSAIKIPGLALPVVEREMHSASGEKKFILWNTSRSEEGNLIGIGYDITERKHAEILLDKKLKELQHKNNELMESIIYAQRIQQNILAEKDGLSSFVSDSFIYYQPKDIVSGDLYWYYKKESKLFVAAVDCTGHGVPGSLMSVMANNLLRDTILKRDLKNPAEILHALDDELQAMLMNESTTDGMDIALCEINLDTQMCRFAGAFRPLVLLRQQQLIELKGSKYPIGLYGDVKKNFDLHEISLQKGDVLYIFSDGYADQFGGEKNKKMNRRNFYDLLASIQDLSMTEQSSFLEYALNNWKQHYSQTDDILVIGLQI